MSSLARSCAVECFRVVDVDVDGLEEGFGDTGLLDERPVRPRGHHEPRGDGESGGGHFTEGCALPADSFEVAGVDLVQPQYWHLCAALRRKRP